mmetsp:Transcript_62407/g.179481  ORF Transcript_62407/g.179481 Transcript_62407/m.179481 type:complete len:220 (-) Transcript_62407:369-1028(-)
MASFSSRVFPRKPSEAKATRTPTASRTALPFVSPAAKARWNCSRSASGRLLNSIFLACNSFCKRLTPPKSNVFPLPLHRNGDGLGADLLAFVVTGVASLPVLSVTPSGCPSASDVSAACTWTLGVVFSAWQSAAGSCVSGAFGLHTKMSMFSPGWVAPLEAPYDVRSWLLSSWCVTLGVKQSLTSRGGQLRELCDRGDTGADEADWNSMDGPPLSAPSP